MAKIFLVFEEDPQATEIPVIIKGGDLSDDYVAATVAEARKAVANHFSIDQLERVMFIKGKIINFVLKKE